MYFSLDRAWPAMAHCVAAVQPRRPGLRATYPDVDGCFGALEPSRANTDAGGSRALARGRLHHGAGEDLVGGENEARLVRPG